jgi:D-sedoheptulose 7-phosphate isomerase
MTRSPDACVDAAVREMAELLPKLARLGPQIAEIGESMVNAWMRDRKILFAGNGGSAADAMHFAEELTIRYHRDRRALAAIAITDPSAITCCGNDYGYDHIFSRQIEALGQTGDVFVGITTSGNSANILKALEAARTRGLKTIGFLGKEGGKAAKLCDIPLIIPSNNTARVQEAHKLIYHGLCDYIDAWALGET